MMSDFGGPAGKTARKYEIGLMPTPKRALDASRSMCGSRLRECGGWTVRADHVGRHSSGMVEGRTRHAGVVGGRKKMHSTSEAGAQDAESGCSLLLSQSRPPRQRNVNHSLAIGVERTPLLAGDSIVGAPSVRRQCGLS